MREVSPGLARRVGMVLTSPSLPGEDGVDGPAGDEGGVHHQPEDQEHGQGEEDGGHLHTLQLRMFLSSGFMDCKTEVLRCFLASEDCGLVNIYSHPQ